LGSVAANNFESSVVSAQGDVEPDKRLTSFNQIEVLVVDTGVICSVIEEELHLFQETGLIIRIELGSELFTSRGCCELSELTHHCWTLRLEGGG
jgi:hypothetical protein